MTTPTAIGRHGIQMRFAAAVTAIGVALMLAMMVTESEPGALPLGMILVGAVWWMLARRKRG